MVDRFVKRYRAGVAATALVASLAATTSTAETQFESPVRADAIDRGGVVYVMTNASTGGRGASDNAAIDPLGSQHALVYDAASESLFAVNAGDNTVSSIDTGTFGVNLRVRSRVPSGGFIPVSVAVSGNRLYVLNAGGTGSVTTFSIDVHGQLMKLASLDLALDGAAGAIAGFAINAQSGVLTPVETQLGLPAAAGLQGIASRTF